MLRRGREVQRLKACIGLYIGGDPHGNKESKSVTEKKIWSRTYPDQLAQFYHGEDFETMEGYEYRGKTLSDL